MSEKKQAAVFTAILVVLGIIFVLGSSFSPEFNFHKSEITINGKYVTERLYFRPDKDYRTLYRNFLNPVFVENRGFPDSIRITSVSCQAGTPYAYPMNGEPVSFAEGDIYLPSVERNEYGCTFGSVRNFIEGHDYWIEATYELLPANVIEVADERYIKFVAYSSGRHKFLAKNYNLFIKGEHQAKGIFLPVDDVSIYIPHPNPEDSSYGIIKKNFFFFENYLSTIILGIFAFIAGFFPLASFLFIWNKYGKETSHADLPRTLSAYPEKRKGWEVAAFFNPPFALVDNNFFSSMMIDFHRRKIIALKSKKKDVFVKIINSENLDAVEGYFISLLKKAEKDAGKKYRDEGFFNMKAVVSYLKWHPYEAQKFKMVTESSIKKASKAYMDMKGNNASILFGMAMLIAGFFSAAVFSVLSGGVMILAALIFIILPSNTTLFMRYKENFYTEFQKWQAFKRYLSEFPSMRDSPPDAVRLWEQYLVYAAALGVAKKVLKRLKEWRVIDNNQYVVFAGVHHSSVSIGSTGAGHSGGGGVGGGGVGGGGGGGR